MTPLADAEGHTPGPWHVGPEGGVAWVATVGPHVVYADGVPEPGSDTADAALIAMAPALLAEVQAARALADAANDGTFTEEMQDAYWAAREATDGGTDG